MVDSVKVGDRVTLGSAVGGGRAYVVNLVSGGKANTASSGDRVSVQKLGGETRTAAVSDVASVDTDMSFTAGDQVLFGDALAEVASQDGRTVRLKVPGQGGGFRDVALHELVLQNGSESART